MAGAAKNNDNSAYIGLASLISSSENKPLSEQSIADSAFLKVQFRQLASRFFNASYCQKKLYIRQNIIVLSCLNPRCLFYLQKQKIWKITFSS
jgi:hypothetical protein